MAYLNTLLHARYETNSLTLGVSLGYYGALSYSVNIPKIFRQLDMILILSVLRPKFAY